MSDVKHSQSPSQRKSSSSNAQTASDTARRRPPKLSQRNKTQQQPQLRSQSSQQQNPQSSSQQDDGHDLTSLLSPSHRADLTLLLASLTSSMRTLLLDNFSATSGLDQSLWSDRTGMSSDEKLLAASDPATADIEKYDAERKLKENYENELSKEDVKKMKEGALQWFDEWAERLLGRVGEVVNKDGKRQGLSGSGEVDEKSGEKAKPRGMVKNVVGVITDVPGDGRSAGGSSLKFKDLYPPTKNPLTKLPMDQRTLILHSVLLLLLSLESYPAHSRVLLLLLTSSLKLPLRTFEQDEYATAKGLLEGVKELTAEQETKRKVEENKESRKWKVGLATAAGAAIIGVTGGLAAPLVAAGVGSVMGGLGLGATSAAAYLGSVAGSTYLVGGLFGAYGGRMTGQMMDSYARQVEDFEFLPVHKSSRDQKTSEDEKVGAKQASEHDHKLRVTICVSGWLTEKEEVVKPWRVLGNGAEVFALKYELEAMLNLGNAMNGLVQSAAWGYAQKQLIAQTIFADLAAAMWPIGLVKAARVIDNPFNVAKSRSEKAGEVLADALINKAQGERPVTLIGYSLGAKVIYSCLSSLATRNAYGLVENAVLIGSPIPSDTADWRKLRTVVAGRLINVYSQNDYVLGFMYRTSSLQYGVAGLQAVKGLPGVENIDVSEQVTGHLKYRFLIGSILKKIGFEDIDMQAVEEERVALEKMEEEEKKNSLEAQRKRLVRRQSSGGKEDEAAEAEDEANEIEKSVREKTQKSLVTRVVEYFYTPQPPSTEHAQKVGTNVQRAAQNPSQVGEVAAGAARDSKASAQTLAQRAYQALPSMPHLSRSNQAEADPTSDATKNAQNIKESSESYTSKAASYLPSMPKNLPSMPSLGRNKAPPKSQSSKAAEGVTQAGQEGVKKTVGTADELLRPTVKNVVNVKDNPAVDAIKDTSKKAPIIHQATKPLESTGIGEKAGEVGEAAGTTVKNSGETVTGAGKSIADKVVSGGQSAASNAANTVKIGGESAQQGDASKDSSSNAQSYTGYAASYLPSMPSWPGRKKPAKLDRKDSSGVKSPPPKLERRGTSTPKLERTKSSSSGVKSPPPKLGPRRTSSGIKSPQSNLQSMTSSVTNKLPSLT